MTPASVITALDNFLKTQVDVGDLSIKEHAH